jgi:hypothetical protein
MEMVSLARVADSTSPRKQMARKHVIGAIALVKLREMMEAPGEDST